MATTSQRKTFEEARGILNRHCICLDGKPASTNTSKEKRMNEDAKDEAWWAENIGNIPPYDSGRSIAYLLAYLEMGEFVFFATGIPLQGGGFIYPDRAVMKSFLLADWVRINKGVYYRFELTDKGRSLLARFTDNPA